jgi:hypothetical protein
VTNPFATHSPKHYARKICQYMAEQPDHYAPDEKKVQQALGMTDEEWKLGMDYCISRKIIVREAAPAKIDGPFGTEDDIRGTNELPVVTKFDTAEVAIAS